MWIALLIIGFIVSLVVFVWKMICASAKEYKIMPMEGTNCKDTNCKDDLSAMSDEHIASGGCGWQPRRRR